MNISPLFLLLALLAEILGTVGGFGSSVFFVPISNFFFDFQAVLGLTALFHLASNVSKIALFRQGLDKRLLLNIGAPAVVFVVLGGYMSAWFVAHTLELILAIFLIGLSLLFLLQPTLKVRAGRTEALLGGGMSGLTAGLLGTGGAIRGITMAAFDLEKSAFIATSAFIDLAIDASRTVVYFHNGYMKNIEYGYLPFLLAVAWIGTWLGKYLLQYIPQERFRQISLVLIFLVGLVMLGRWWLQK